MTNREKYAEQILDVVCQNMSSFALTKESNRIVTCAGIKCDECAFQEKGGCIKQRSKWANSEYIEKLKISESDRRFLDYIPGKYKWMARDKDGYLHVYDSKVEKTDICWTLARYVTMDMSAFKISFPMVKWEDEEPWLIEDLKKLEVE